MSYLLYQLYHDNINTATRYISNFLFFSYRIFFRKMMSELFNEFLMVFGAIQIANADLVCDVPGLCQVSNLTKLYLHKRKLEVQSNLFFWIFLVFSGGN